jgi:hypothetical protein
MTCVKSFISLEMWLTLRSLYFIIVLSEIRSTLVSRMRYPNEYVARPDYDPEDMDESMYADLLIERPDLKNYLRPRALPFLSKDYGDSSRKSDAVEHNGEYNMFTLNEDYGDVEETTIKQNVSSTLRRLPYITRWAERTKNVTNNKTKSLSQDKKNLMDKYFVGRFIAKCFWCGMNSSGIPRSPLCHDAFDSSDSRARTLARFFRAYCYKHPEGLWAMRKKKWNKYDLTKSDALIKQYYGKFIGGCFKRFLDVGKVYTQRGCRAQLPPKSFHSSVESSELRSFASHRFAKLEYPLLKTKRDMCIVSPHASLTPFNRAISLYARYHVCICNKAYCNNSNTTNSSIILLMIIIYEIFK